MLVLANGGGLQPAQSMVDAISPADKAQGAKANKGLTAKFGGRVSGPQATYVEGSGKKIAVQSGLSAHKAISR